MYVSQCKKDNLIAGLICSIGGTVFGYDLGALSAVSQSLRSEFSLSPSTYGFTIAASLWGTVVGSMFAGYIAVCFGGRTLIASCALIYAMATTAIAFFGSADWGIVLALRFLCGIAIGGLTVGCPLYLSQIAPSEQRGKFIAWFQVQVGIGVVLGFAIGYVAAHLEPLALYWRVCFGFGAIPPAILLLFLHRMPEGAHRFDRKSSQYRERNPKWLSEDKISSKIRTGTERDGKLFRRRNLRPLLLATSLALFNQLSGVNILLLYLLDVLSNTGANFLQSHRSTLVIAILGPLTTIGGDGISGQDRTKAPANFRSMGYVSLPFHS
jgi:MFS family permease